VRTMAFRWKKVRTFNEFLSEFERYVNEYFTKDIILVNRVKLEERHNGKTIRFEVSTPSIDIIFEISTEFRVIIESYFTDSWMGGPNHIYHDWDGQVLSEEQFERFLSLAKKMVDYYHNNSDKFGKARAEAFMNLIFGTKGKVVDALEEVLGEETATALIAHELGVFPKEGGGDDSR